MLQQVPESPLWTLCLEGPAVEAVLRDFGHMVASISQASSQAVHDISASRNDDVADFFDAVVGQTGHKGEVIAQDRFAQTR